MSLDMRATILVAALAERLPHLPLTDFGRRTGQGITAPDVPVSRTRVPSVESEA